MLGLLAQSWDALKEAFYPMAIALMGYITYWLRTHVGKSNGHGPLNNQAEDLIKRISRLEKHLDVEPTDEEDQSDSSD